MEKIIQKLTFAFLVCFIIIGCSTLKEVRFKTPVDTTNKKIILQEKKVFSIQDLNLHASNSYDGARLNGFEKVNDSVVKVIIKPENTPINNSAYYSFKLWSEKPQTIYLKFDYPKEFKHRYIPKLKKTNFEWHAIDSLKIFKKEKNVFIELSVDKDTTWVSAQELVTSTDTRAWYKKITKGKTYIQVRSAGSSVMGKNLPVLDIYKGIKKHKPIVVLLTRQHPPEVTGFFAFQEFLQTLLKENKLTNDFFNKYRVLAFPILNPDGVDLGHWRHNANGVDTNRDWSEYNQPEIKQVAKFIMSTSKKDKGSIILGLDFHSTYEDVFYTNEIREETTLPGFITKWFEALEENIPNYRVNEKSSISKKPVSKGWFLYGHNAVGITYEIGDATSKEKIKLVGRVTAEQMMKILLGTNY